MKITLRLFATLAKYLPPGATEHEVELDVPNGTTPAAVVKRFNLPADLVHLILVNGIYVAPEQRNKKPLKEKDIMAIFPPIAGG